MTAYIFDFDGTLADSFDYVLDWLATEVRGSAAAKDLHHADYRGLAMYELPLKFKVWPWRWLNLFKAGQTKMGQDMSQIRIFDDLAEVIKRLHANGHQLFVVSANNSQNIELFLEQNNLTDYFKAIKGGAVFNKSAAIRKLLKQNHISTGRAWYVGDEAHDITAARHAGVKTMAVTWGYNNLERLSAKRPDRLIFEPAELLTDGDK